MHLYYSPGACSTVPHIVLEELGYKYELVKVDLKNKTYAGGDFKKVNPKGQVPVLELDTKQIITENAIICQYLADQKPDSKLLPSGGMERYRHLETLNFITTEIHKSFGPFFNPKSSDEDKKAAGDKLKSKFDFLDHQLNGREYLMGNSFALPDAYLFVMTRWAKNNKLDLESQTNVQKHFERMSARPAVKKALAQEDEKH